MYVIDPDTGLPDNDNLDPAAAAAEGADTDKTASEHGVPIESAADEGDDLLAAMDEGIESATDPVPGTNEAADAERAAAETAEKAKTEDEPKPGDKAEPDKDTEDEIKALGLKEKSAERFRDLTKQVKELAPLKEQLEKAGIKDVAELPRLVQEATDGRDLVKMVSDTGVTPDDFTRLLEYGGIIAAGRKGDRAAVERAFKTVEEEYHAIAKALGKEIPGVYDPLSEHSDLAEAVASGDMTQKHAMEVAQARRTQSAIAQQRQQTEQQTRAQQEQQQAVQQGVQSLMAWEQQKAAADPHYKAKRDALNIEVYKIRKQFPPSQWAAATELAYAAIPNPAPKEAPRQQATNAVRPSGPRANMAPTEFASDDDALMFGIQQAAG